MGEINNKTSADKSSIGFDYQFFYFISLLLGLKKGESIGYEVFDDIHINLHNGGDIWMQLKHSLQTNKSGKVKNISERDEDIWKTLYNWCKVIKNYTTDQERSEFIHNKKFILITNKSNNNNNFLNSVEKLKQKEIGIGKFKDYLRNLKNGYNKKSKMHKYLSVIISLNNKVMEEFINNVAFQLEEDELVEQIKDKIQDKYIAKSRVEDVFSVLIGEFEVWKYNQIKKNEKLILTYEMINRKCTRIFEMSRLDRLPRRDYNIVLPEKLVKQQFIKELIEIEEIDQDDQEEIVEYTTSKLKILNNLNEWLKENLITNTEIGDFNNNVKLIWKNEHKNAHEGTKKEIKNKSSKEVIEYENNLCSRKCLTECRRSELEIAPDDKLDKELSNGYFYLLSDQEKIGWKYKWRGKYNEPIN